MKRLILITSLLLLPLYALATDNTVLVVSNKDCKINSLNRNQVFDLYLGRIQSIDGTRINLLDIKQNEQLRKDFYQYFTQMSLPQLNAYWARLQFTGKVFPPNALTDQRDVLEYIGSHSNSIGFIYAEELSSDVKVLCCDK